MRGFCGRTPLSVVPDGYLHFTANQPHRQPQIDQGQGLREKPYALFPRKARGGSGSAAIGRAGHGRMLHEIAGLVEAGRLGPFNDGARFTLETAPDAYRHLASSEARGKIVIDISDPRGQ
jgi:hypothetical protein